MNNFIKQEYCKEFGYGSFNKYNKSDYSNWLEKKLIEARTQVENSTVPVASNNEADKAKAQQKENIVAIMQSDEKDGIYQSEEKLSCKCPICSREMTSQLVKHHHCKKCNEHYTTT